MARATCLLIISPWETSCTPIGIMNFSLLHNHIDSLSCNNKYNIYIYIPLCINIIISFFFSCGLNCLERHVLHLLVVFSCTSDYNIQQLTVFLAINQALSYLCWGLRAKSTLISWDLLICVCFIISFCLKPGNIDNYLGLSSLGRRAVSMLLTLHCFVLICQTYHTIKYILFTICQFISFVYCLFYWCHPYFQESRKYLWEGHLKMQ